MTLRPTWWTPPIFSDPRSAERGHIAYAILRAGTLVSLLLLLSSPFAQSDVLRTAANYGVLFLVHLGHLKLLRMGRVQLAVRSFCFCYFALVTATVLQFGGLRGPVG